MIHFNILHPRGSSVICLSHTHVSSQMDLNWHQITTIFKGLIFIQSTIRWFMRWKSFVQKTLRVLELFRAICIWWIITTGVGVWWAFNAALIVFIFVFIDIINNIFNAIFVFDNVRLHQTSSSLRILGLCVDCWALPPPAAPDAEWHEDGKGEEDEDGAAKPERVVREQSLDVSSKFRSLDNININIRYPYQLLFTWWAARQWPIKVRTSFLSCSLASRMLSTSFMLPHCHTDTL